MLVIPYMEHLGYVHKWYESSRDVQARIWYVFECFFVYLPSLTPIDCNFNGGNFLEHSDQPMA